MQSNRSFDVLTYLPGEEHQSQIQAYQHLLAPLVEKMQQLVSDNNPVANHQAFRDYTTYCRWPIRQMEYSFFIRHLPEKPSGLALDAGSGVTPFPYLLANQGWETTSTDIEIEQMELLQRYGKEAYGIGVSHQVEDLRDMNFPDQHFSLITCVSVLEHLQHSDVPTALSELVRIAKPGAKIIISTDVYPNDHPHIPVNEGAFTHTKLRKIYTPLAIACDVINPFIALCDHLASLTMDKLDKFWSSHWQPGYWENTNRGYGAIGMVFNLPNDVAACHRLFTELKYLSLIN